MMYARYAVEGVPPNTKATEDTAFQLLTATFTSYLTIKQGLRRAYMERDGRGKIAHYLLVVILLCAVVASFFSFVQENKRRILDQNQTYAHDAALQAASRVEDMLEARSTTLNLLSITAAEKIKGPWIGQDFLKLLQETSVFDYVEFIDADGLNHNADGVTSDSSDRKNYLMGIRGKTGFNVVFNSRITHETIVIFYTPVRYQGEIFGVLNGMFREETLQEAIAVEFFGADAKSMICMEDGTVISSYGYGSPVEDLLDGLAQDNVVSEKALSELWNAFTARCAFCCTVRGEAGDISVSLVPIGDDWMLVQTFPSAVTKQMEANANGAGIKLESRLILLSLIYVAFLILTNLRKRRQLTSEKVRLSGIVEGLVPLFARLVIVELEQQSYEYLKGAPSDLPVRGAVKDLDRYMLSHYLPDEEDGNPADMIPNMERIKASLSEGVPFLQYEYRIRWDEERWETASVLNARQKDTVLLIFAIQDVTVLRRERETIQQTLRDAFHAAEELSRAKSDFLGRMSHDMRTPMNAVLGMASIALSHLDDSARVQDCLEKIDASGRQLLSLINEVLDMSKIESGGLVLNEAGFDLTGEINKVLAEARRAAAKKDLRLNVEIAPFDHRAVRGDSERLRQVLRNLLENAVKYTPSGGAVTFRSCELPSCTSKSGYYEFAVEDTGMGIDPAFQPKIFEPFVRGEFRRGDLGTGLGLSIAQTVVKLMNGDIKVESEPGRGSKFTVHVYLKLEGDGSPCPELQKADPAESGSKSVMRHAGVRVLLVEDIKVNMIIAREMLKKAGLLVETAENGAEAVVLAQENPPAYYDLIFMDLQMPVMDGYEASRTIRALGREDLQRIPIVAVTANAFQEDVSRAKDAGMNDLVMKPADLDSLLAALDKWLPDNSPKNEFSSK